MTKNVKWHGDDSSMKYFEVILAFTHFFGFSTIVMHGYFFNTFSNGLGWPDSNSGKGTQLHGFLMVLGFIFFQGEALLSYRVYRYNAKIVSKMIHTFLHVIAIGLGITALVVIILNKKWHGYDQFSSVHSWIGVCFLIIYVIQFSFGFFTFLFPCTPNSYRARLIPLHRSVGAACLILGCIQSVVGYATFLNMTAPSCFDNLTCPNRLEYVAGIAVLTTILYTLLVLALIAPSSWKRAKTPDELK